MIIVISGKYEDVLSKFDEIKNKRNLEYEILYYSADDRMNRYDAANKIFHNFKSGLDTYILTTNINTIHNKILRKYVDEACVQYIGKRSGWRVISGPITDCILI